MGKPPAKKKMPKEVVDGLFDKLIDGGENPDDEELEWFAKQLGGTTKEIMKDHFRARYRSRTGTTDDPYGPLPGNRDQV